MWLTSNPGRQILTGSFHPVPPENWADKVRASAVRWGGKCGRGAEAKSRSG
jgi:hypothetical protein